MGGGQGAPGPPCGRAAPRRRVSSLTWALVALATAYLAKAFFVALSAPAGASDLRLRWVEVQWFLAGYDPHRVFLRGERPEHGEAGAPHGPTTTRDRPLGGYPPWSVVVFVPVCAWSWPVARGVWAVLEALALVTIARWAWLQAREAGPGARALAASGALAVAGHVGAIGLGNASTVVLGALCHAHALQAGRSHGVWLALANLKPTVAGPFLLAPLLARRPAQVFAATFTLVASAWVAGRWTGEGALGAVGAWLAATDRYKAAGDWGGGYGPYEVLTAAGLPHAAAAPFAAAAFASLAVAGLLRLGPTSLQGWAVAGVAARSWSYHMAIDNVILTPLLTAACVRASTRGGLRAWTWFLALGASLWSPSSWTTHLGVQLAQFALWLGSAAWLVAVGPEALASSAPKDDRPPMATP